MKECRIQISRYNPDVDSRPVLKEYRVPKMEGATVLEALLYVYEEIDSTLLFQFGCRYKMCGKCAMRINGRPGLACKTPLEEGLILEPLENFPVIRDLAIDRSSVMYSLQKQQLVISPGSEGKDSIQPLEYYDLITCNECLSCLSNCPVFSLGQAEGAPLFNVRTAELHYDVRDKAQRLGQLSAAYACTTCQACTAFCPAEIDMEKIVDAMRRRVFEKGTVPESLLTMRDRIHKKGNIYGLPRKDRIAIYPPSFRRKLQEEALPSKAETLLFMGCVPSYLDMRIVPSLLEVLDLSGIEYTSLSSAEKCCGFPLYLMGAEEFGNYAKGIVEQIRGVGARALVTPCAGCYKTFEKIYPRYVAFGVKVQHSLQYLTQLISEGGIGFRKEIRKRVTYHDPCDLGRGFGLFEEPRSILRNIPGVQFVEMAKNRLNARCCGGGGGVQAHNPNLALKMATDRVWDALHVGAEIIVSGCPACKDSLKKGARAIPKADRGKIKIMDITEIVVAAARE